MLCDYNLKMKIVLDCVYKSIVFKYIKWRVFVLFYIVSLCLECFIYFLGLGFKRDIGNLIF